MGVQIQGGWGCKLAPKPDFLTRLKNKSIVLKTRRKSKDTKGSLGAYTLQSG
jgi:hypothetical protein